jgi:flagellar M-ring protein FliF
MTDGNDAANPPLINGSLKPKIMLAAGVLGLTAVIALATVNLREPQYSVLFANLSDRDGGSIIEDLNRQNIPFRFAAGGNAIMVPSKDVHAIRLKLASEGLPRGANVGFELMDSQGFGVTQFQEKLNYQRGLQGELSRSIESLAAVESARVHLSIPNNNGFLRSQSKASASVLVTLFPGQYLDRNQSAGIVHLVAASIGRLSPQDVTVIDQNGNLLINKDSENNGPNPTQMAYVQSVESRLSNRVIELLEPIVGRGNVRARVTADIDFTATQSTDEIYQPNQGGQPAAVRSRQLRSEGGANGANGAGGIAGALSNQPTPNGQAPINGAAQNTQAANANGAAGENGAKGNEESVTNYEVNKSVRVTRNEVGAVRRLTAAVVINHRRSVDKEGKVTFTPLDPQEIQQMDALVRRAIGFTDDRGDSINIMNSPFVEEPEVPVSEVPIWKDPQITGLALEVTKHLGIILLGLLTIFKVIKPALRSVSESSTQAAIAAAENENGSRVNAVVEGDVELPAPETPKQITAQASQEAQRLAAENPAAVASVVRNWVGEA